MFSCYIADLHRIRIFELLWRASQVAYSLVGKIPLFNFYVWHITQHLMETCIYLKYNQTN